MNLSELKLNPDVEEYVKQSICDVGLPWVPRFSYYRLLYHCHSVSIAKVKLKDKELPLEFGFGLCRFVDYKLFDFGTLLPVSLVSSGSSSETTSN